MKILLHIVSLFYLVFLFFCGGERQFAARFDQRSEKKTDRHEGTTTISGPPESFCSAKLTGTVQGGDQGGEKGGEKGTLTLELLLGQGTLHLGSAQTSEDGHFTFPRIPPGAYRLTCRKPGYAVSKSYLWIEEGANQTSLTLGTAAPVKGAVIDQYRRPVKGATVTAWGEDRGAALESSTTDESGRFSFRMLTAGSYEIRAQAKGYQATGQPGVAAPQDKVELRLTRLFSLRGKVALDREKISGAVKLRIGGSGIWPWREITVDPQGKFIIQKIPEGVYEVAARSEGAPWLASEVLDGLQIGPEDPDPITLQLLAAHRVKGTVLYGEEPVPGATLILGREALAVLQNRATTDARGRFDFDPVAPSDFVISVWAKGFLPIIENKIQSDATGLVRFYLKKGGVLNGQVLDSRGYPVASATVRPIVVETPAGDRSAPVPGVLGVTAGPVPPIPAHDQPLSMPMGFTAPSSTTTRDDGGFSLTGLPRGKIRVVVEHQDYSPTRSPVMRFVTSRSRSVKLVLKTGTRVQGQVLDSMGRPVNGVVVQLHASSSTRTSLTGPTGEFQFTGLSGTVSLTATMRGFFTTSKRIKLKEKIFFGVDLVLLEATGILEGHVLSQKGVPVSGADIFASQGKHRRRGKTGRDGSFSLSGLGQGTVSVRVVHKNHGEVTKELAGVHGELVEIRFSALGRVFGVVQDHRTGAPVKKFKVTRQGSSKGQRLRVERSQNGGFTIRGLRLGSHPLLFESTGYAPRKVKAIARESEDVGSEILVELQRAGHIEGAVTLPSGAAVAGAKVSCQGIVSTTDGRGGFTLKNLPEGLHRLQVEHEGRILRSEPIFVRPEETSGPVRILFR